MSDDTVDVKIHVDATSHEEGMHHAAEATHEATEKMRESLEQLTATGGNTAEAMKGLVSNVLSFGNFGEAIASTEAFTAALGTLATTMAVALPAAVLGIAGEQFVEVGASLYTMSKQTGVAVEELDVMRQVATESGTSLDTIGSSIYKFQRAIGEAGDDTTRQAAAFDALGVSLNTADGKAKDTATLFKEVAAALRESAPGFEKNEIAMALLGRTGPELNKFLEEYAEAGGRAAVVTTDMAEKAERLEKAWNSVKLGIKNALLEIGDAMITVKDSAGEFFTSMGDTIGYLWTEVTAGEEAAMAQHKLAEAHKEAMRAEKEHKEAEVGSVKRDDIGKRQKGKAPDLTGEIDKAMLDILKESGAAESQLIDTRINLMAATGKYSQAQLDMLRALQQTAEAEKEANRAPGAALKEATAALEQMKLARKAALDPATGEEEVAFWQRVMDSIDVAKLSTEQYAALQKNILSAMAATAEEAEKDSKKAMADLLGEREAEIKADAEAKRAMVQEERRALNEAVALRQISKEQAFAQERAFVDQIRGIDAEQFDALANLYGDDLKKHQQYLTEKLKADTKAADDKSKLTVKAMEEEQKTYQKAADSIGNAFGHSFDGLIKGTQNWSQAGKKLEIDLADEAIKASEKMLAKFIADQAVKLIVQKTSQAATVQSDAAMAASAAYQSAAAIPFVGWILGPAAAAAAYVAVSAYAEDGYDIPAGVNPVVQAHAREMILPQEHADTIRNLGKSGGGGGDAGGGATFHVHANDSEDVAKFLRRHGSKIADVVAGRYSGANFRPNFL